MDGKKMALYALTVVLALFFIVVQGLGKLFGFGGVDASQVAATFGYSTGFMLLIGVLELLGGIGLLLPQVRRLAALGLVGLMIGAIVSHVRAPETLAAIPVPILTLVALALVIKLSGGVKGPGPDPAS